MSVKGLFAVMVVIILALVLIAGTAIQGLIDGAAAEAAERAREQYGAEQFHVQLTAQAVQATRAANP